MASGASAGYGFGSGVYVGPPTPRGPVHPLAAPGRGLAALPAEPGLTRPAAAGLGHRDPAARQALGRL
ncbi:hypothetical protein J2S52_004075 [Streptomyces sp. DSM 41037]|uniref:Uncharacterized protein n=1 Tax=Streptomyces griseus TaxID=1911 RepID=A0A380ND44_STRGR|nr:hypothetical protein [Streptomyces sp. DSM 41037]SUP38046.1 Uncharacterised protein [Streptomyces griseus]